MKHPSKIALNIHLLNDKVDNLIIQQQQIPSDLILESNKLMNDYNESLKKIKLPK
jgi:hypothetical protein